ncbi:unnamed protein product, partial [Meganyctiphanes norvegica]
VYTQRCKAMELISILLCLLPILQSFAINEDCLINPYPKNEDISFPKKINLTVFLSSTEKLNLQTKFKDFDYLRQSDHLQISSDECIVEKRRTKYGIIPKIEDLNCSHITQGWHQLNISITPTDIVIENYLTYSFDHPISNFSTTATHTTYCCERSPTWKVTEAVPIKIPLSSQNNVNLILESNKPFTPVLDFGGNFLSFSWIKKSIAISKIGPPLPEGQYVLYINNQSEQLELTFKPINSDNCEPIINNIGNRLDELVISSSNSNFYCILNLHEN